jgi:hypothetical protein
MAFDYDATDAAPTSKQAITAYSGSTRTNAWNRLTCDLRPPSGWFYVGSSPSTINPSGTDLKFYDIARFYLGVFNASPGATVGELSVEYDVEFSKPDFSPLLINEMVTFANSNYASPVGTPTVVGSPVFTLSSPAPGQLALNFLTNGKFLMEICAFMTSSTSLGNCFQSPSQSDPSGAFYTLPWAENVTTGWTSASNSMTALNLLAATVQVGSQILISAAVTVTAMGIYRIRVAPYALT